MKSAAASIRSITPRGSTAKATETRSNRPWRTSARAKARALAEFESAYVARVLAAAGGNVTLAARIAGKERRSFGKLLKKHGIDKAQYHS